ncbi:hypothetical protein ACFV2X_20220 [Streptomyces sp. NPDC059679]|uniref:hypothetical protein n=1 Tax=Streptomyces sp. NPDC059679 TaxID=3346903 RepID=UPI0036A8DD9B
MLPPRLVQVPTPLLPWCFRQRDRAVALLARPTRAPSRGAGRGHAPRPAFLTPRSRHDHEHSVRLSSYLMEITAEVLARTYSATGKPLVDIVADAPAQKGTGRWTMLSYSRPGPVATSPPSGRPTGSARRSRRGEACTPTRPSAHFLRRFGGWRTQLADARRL